YFRTLATSVSERVRVTGETSHYVDRPNLGTRQTGAERLSDISSPAYRNRNPDHMRIGYFPVRSVAGIPSPVARRATDQVRVGGLLKMARNSTFPSQETSSPAQRQ